ncbi:uncharacterized protein LOC110689456 [Chenopodium quinoa]|uniref:uncharacterized protein LOC110689456 n=1 Tax=Chenopodium quinoa TaxID=63459 RepID=UPI000B78C075|nr:uncharacterized protein LOC110689456 [Chenopodium quinoa]
MRFASEKNGGNDRAKWKMANFRATIDFCGFRSVAFSGYAFTYDNGRDELDNTQCRLDRALTNDSWFASFPEAHVIHIDPEWSDHAPIKLVLFQQPSFSLGEILSGLSNIGSKMKDRKKLQKLNRGGLTASQIEQRRSLLRDIEGLIKHEELYWRQRSRVSWLAEGDRNTKFFHQRASGRKRKKFIRSLKDSNGDLKAEDEVIGRIAVKYFKNLFSSSSPSIIEFALQDFQSRVMDDMNAILRRSYSAEEVKFALDQMHPIKALGPDVLANRLKEFLDKIISVQQSAFTYSGESWSRCVMNCVRSVSFSMLINGKPYDVFTPSRGIQQGNPLSPYLFILCADIFSHLLQRAEECGTLHGIRIAPTAPDISHLLFADDCIIFSKANMQDLEAINDVLEVYEKSSGQNINFDKTTIFFSKGVGEGKRKELANRCGVRVVDIHDRYLGLPTVVGRSKKVITKGITEKLWKKLQGWKGMVLSKAGREVMIKAVAQSLPTYAISVFKFPSSFCDELKSLVAQFWWGQKQGERKLHWLAWKKLCRSKKEGGLRFRDFKLFNRDLLGKQAWRLVAQHGSLIERVNTTQILHILRQRWG